jgi:hypothetical protein
MLSLAAILVLVALVPAGVGDARTPQPRPSDHVQLAAVHASTDVASPSAPAPRTPWFPPFWSALLAATAIGPACARRSSTRISLRRVIATFGLARSRRAPPFAFS